jgi:hypothetical protein
LQILLNQETHIAALNTTISTLTRTQEQQLKLQQTSASTSSAPPSPAWDGSYEHLKVHMEELKLFKLHPFFQSVTDWKTADPFSSTQSLQHLHKEMLAKLSKHLLPIFLNDVRYTHDGIAMLDRTSPPSTRTWTPIVFFRLSIFSTSAFPTTRRGINSSPRYVD